MNILIGVLGLLIFSFLIYLLIVYLLTPKPFNPIGDDTMQLSKVTQVITSEELKNYWTSNAGSTLVFYINPKIRERTGISGNEYAKVVQIGSKQAFKILVAPDAGRGLTLAPALLEIYVKGYENPEIVEITNFPLQRWTAVTIVKIGRKFNVYLNGVPSVSHTCTAMPDFDETQPLRVGSSRLGGVISYMSMAPSALKTNEVRDLFDRSVDVSGKPYSPITFSTAITPLIPSLPSGILDYFSLCPGGNCDFPKRAGPLEEWFSPYA